MSMLAKVISAGPQAAAAGFHVTMLLPNRRHSCSRVTWCGPFHPSCRRPGRQQRHHAPNLLRSPQCRRPHRHSQPRPACHSQYCSTPPVAHPLPPQPLLPQRQPQRAPRHAQVQARQPAPLQHLHQRQHPHQQRRPQHLLVPQLPALEPCSRVPASHDLARARRPWPHTPLRARPRTQAAPRAQQTPHLHPFLPHRRTQPGARPACPRSRPHHPWPRPWHLPVNPLQPRPLPHNSPPPQQPLPLLPAPVPQAPSP